MCVDYTIAYCDGLLEYDELPAQVQYLLDTGAPEEINAAILEWLEATHGAAVAEMIKAAPAESD